VLNFKYDDFDPIEKKYKPQFRKSSNYRNYYYQDTVDILDQNRFKFILNLEIEEQSYNKYLYSNNSNLKWEDIYIVICYLENLHTCAICLEKGFICPVITRCGHIFCWPCIDNYYEYWTVAAINKKQPKCPLCKELINPEELKICEIIQCVNYMDSSSSSNYNEDSLDIITFNLIMKEKKGQVLYNINCDPDLSYFKEYYLNDNNDNLNPNCVLNNQNKSNLNNANNKSSSGNKKFIPNFNFIPLEKAEEFSFSRIFTSKKEYIIHRLKELQKNLETSLKEELETEQDIRRIQSLTKCIELMKSDLAYYDNNNQNKFKNRNENKEIQIEEEKDKYKKKENNNLTYQIENEKIYDNLKKQEININNSKEDKNIISTQIIENLSTVDEDSQNLNKPNPNEFGTANIIDLKNYFFFYQESKGDIYLLHPINYQILLKEYEMEDHLPTNITVNINNLFSLII